MKLVQLFLLFSLAVRLSANKVEDVAGESNHPYCAAVKVDGAYAEAAARAKEQDIVGNLAKSRESVNPSLDTVWKQTANPETDASSLYIEYGQSFAIYAGLPAFCLLLSILIYPICCSCHLCANCCGYYGCRCCCCPPKRDDTYSRPEQTKSCVIYSFVALMTFICVIIGITGGNTFATGLLEMSCKLDGMRVTGKNLFGQLLKPADDLVSKIDGIVNATNVSMQVAHKNRGGKYTHERLTLYQETIQNLTEKAMEVNASSYPFVSSGLCNVYQTGFGCLASTSPYTNDAFDCELCANPASLTALKDALEENLRSPSESIKKETNAILTEIVSAQSLIKNGVGGVKNSLGMVTSFMDDGGVWETSAAQLIQVCNTAKENASTATGVPFGLVMVGIFLTVLGFLAMKMNQGSGKHAHPMSLGCIGKCGSCCVGCGWNLTCLTMIIFFLLCAVLWPIMYLSVDMCVVLDDKFPNQVGDYVPLDSGSSKMIQSCFTPGGNASFIPDDLLANFDFSQTVTFNSADLKDDIDGLFQALPMDVVRSFVNNMTNFTTANITAASSPRKERMEAIMEMKELMAKVDAAESKYKDAMIISIDNIGEISNITKPMFSFADGIMDDFSCLAVGKEFRATTDILCGSIVPGMSLFIMAVLFTALLGFPLACAGISVNKTMGGHGLPKNHDSYDSGNVELTGFPMAPEPENNKNYI